MRSWLALVVLLLAPAAKAQAPAVKENPDLEIARRHFSEGRRHYEESNYSEALKEFIAARRVLEVPALDFDIARCHDRLEQFAEAVQAYERYVQSQPEPADAAEVRERIRLLRLRVPPPEAPSRPPAPAPTVAIVAPPPVPPTRPSRRWLWLAVGGPLVAVTAVVLGVTLGLERDPTASFGVVHGN